MKFDEKDYAIILQVLYREKDRIESTDSEHETETPQEIAEAIQAVETIGTY